MVANQLVNINIEQSKLTAIEYIKKYGRIRAMQKVVEHITNARRYCEKDLQEFWANVKEEILNRKD